MSEKNGKSTQMGKVGQAAGGSFYAFFIEMKGLLKFFVQFTKKKQTGNDYKTADSPDQDTNE